MGKRQAANLLSLPLEIIFMILAYVPSRDLSQNVEMTCKQLRQLMTPLYQVKYGHGPAPFFPVSDSSWKRFAIQFEDCLSDSDHIRNELVNQFLESYFDSPDDYELGDSGAVIYYLHNNPHIHTRGIEAIVAALNIQHRRQESNAFLSKYRDSDDMPLQSMTLLQARFNLHLSVSWSTCSSESLERCLLAAATSGNIELFVYLKTLLLEAGQDVQVLPAVYAAVRSDEVEILRDLQSTFGVEFHSLPLDSLIEVAVKFGSANSIQFLLERGPVINLENPYQLALHYCNLDVLRQLEKHSPHIVGTFLPNGNFQVAFILATDLMSWEKKAKTIEYLVEHDSVDINATGKDGLTTVHIAALNNHIDALKLFEILGANMSSLGEVGQTPAEIALCHGYNIPFIGCSSLPVDLLATKRNIAKAIIDKYCDTIFEGQRGCSRFDCALNDAESKLADIWAKKIGLETLRGLLSIIATPLFKSVEKLLKIKTDFDTRPIESKEVQLRGGDEIKEVLNNFLSQKYPDEYLTRLACYSETKLAALDIKNLRNFIDSRSGRSLHLAKRSFAKEEFDIRWEFRKSTSGI